MVLGFESRCSTNLYVVMFVPRLLFLMVFGFAEIGIRMILGFICHDFGWTLGRNSTWHFWYLNLLFGMLGGFSLGSWGTLERSWDIGEHKKEYFEIQAYICNVLEQIQGHHFDSFLGTLYDPGFFF